MIRISKVEKTTPATEEKKKKRLMKPKVISSKRSIKIDKKMQIIKYKIKMRKMPTDTRKTKT